MIKPDNIFVRLLSIKGQSDDAYVLLSTEYQFEKIKNRRDCVLIAKIHLTKEDQKLLDVQFRVH